tara:strand:+ start:1226 stop:2659 length:1434 start_codon:yes stop_codon:yes gene_type:complete
MVSRKIKKHNRKDKKYRRSVKLGRKLKGGGTSVNEMTNMPNAITGWIKKEARTADWRGHRNIRTRYFVFVPQEAGFYYYKNNKPDTTPNGSIMIADADSIIYNETSKTLSLSSTLTSTLIITKLVELNTPLIIQDNSKWYNNNPKKDFTNNPLKYLSYCLKQSIYKKLYLDDIFQRDFIKSKYVKSQFVFCTHLMCVPRPGEQPESIRAEIIEIDMDDERINQELYELSKEEESKTTTEIDRVINNLIRYKIKPKPLDQPLDQPLGQEEYIKGVPESYLHLAKQEWVSSSLTSQSWETKRPLELAEPEEETRRKRLEVIEEMDKEQRRKKAEAEAREEAEQKEEADPHTDIGEYNYFTLDMSKEEAGKEYRRMAAKYHPDKHGNSPEATARFQAIQEEYDRFKIHKGFSGGRRQNSSKFKPYKYTRKNPNKPNAFWKKNIIQLSKKQIKGRKSHKKRRKSRKKRSSHKSRRHRKTRR